MIQFLVHDKRDSVGVAVVDVKAGQTLEGRSLDTNETLKAKANMDIPLGHKIALKDFKPGDTVRVHYRVIEGNRERWVDEWTGIVVH